MEKYEIKPKITLERRFPRYDHCCSIRYKLFGHSPTEVFSGVARNISRGGICLYIYQRLDEGQRIEIISSLPVGTHSAVLRWIKEEDSLFVSGWMFVEG
jgi:hypothetical protein